MFVIRVRCDRAHARATLHFIYCVVVVASNFNIIIIHTTKQRKFIYFFWVHGRRIAHGTQANENKIDDPQVRTLTIAPG